MSVELVSRSSHEERGLKSRSPAIATGLSRRSSHEERGLKSTNARTGAREPRRSSHEERGLKSQDVCMMGCLITSLLA